MTLRIKILGRVWQLQSTPRLGNGVNGKCDPPGQKGKQILIRSTLRGELLLETLIHEITHAADWNLAEEFVEEFAADLARTLWRIGYRGMR